MKAISRASNAAMLAPLLFDDYRLQSRFELKSGSWRWHSLVAQTNSVASVRNNEPDAAAAMTVTARGLVAGLASSIRHPTLLIYTFQSALDNMYQLV